jgi:phospholipase C
VRRTKLLIGLRALAVVLLALGSFDSATVGRVTADPSYDADLGKIDHIVIIVQENRSFNNLFFGFPNAVTSKTGKCTNGKTITLHSQSMATTWDISHGLQDAKTADDMGAMDGFCDEYTQGPKPSPQYAYVPQKEIEPYWDLAKQYVLGDNTFASQLDGSFVAHQYLIAGWAGGSYNLPAAAPWGCDGGTGNAVGLLNGAGQPAGITFPCFTYKTLAGELDTKKVSWRTYSPPVDKSDPEESNLGYYLNGYDAIKQIREGSDWTTDNLHPETRILHDVKKGDLAGVTWVIPSLLLSDHAGSDSDRGPSWVASVVNAIGESKFWSSTAIFVVWDDWGGWYDGVSPPALDYDGLGMRVPLLCISPYAKTGYVDHSQYEFGSLLKFVEQRFDLPSLGRTDARAASPLGCFNFAQKPRAFHKIQTTYTVEDVVAHATDLPADDQ